ncbi:SPFH domain-containing protein [Nocardia niigatensis]|uniref:SPFH domain-containing protein n=1 Tax=Nocardia niigatensis TaxID=209249 RepID=UPI000316CD25|nr:SPFH domain-containing protein [Nocardia niigatensis]
MDVLYLLVGWLAAFAVIIGIGLAAGVRVVTQYEKGVVFRLGRVRSVREPGMRLLIPGVDKMQKISMQVITMPVPAQEGITRDNVTVRVDAVVYFRVIDPLRALIEVQDYLFAVAQVAQTSLRSIIGKSELDDLLSNREQLNKGLEIMIDSPAVNWGVHIDRVEIKDVALPDALKRSMSRQAEAERERRARIISAEGELQASEKLAAAAANMAHTPAALQLRFLETVVQVAAEKNSTLVLPFPVELLRFFERRTHQQAAAAVPGQETERPALGPAELGELMAALAQPSVREALAALEQADAREKTNAAGEPGGGKESA